MHVLVFEHVHEEMHHTHQIDSSHFGSSMLRSLACALPIGPAPLSRPPLVLG